MSLAHGYVTGTALEQAPLEQVLSSDAPGTFLVFVRYPGISSKPKERRHYEKPFDFSL